MCVCLSVGYEECGFDALPVCMRLLLLCLCVGGVKRVSSYLLFAVCLSVTVFSLYQCFAM